MTRSKETDRDAASFRVADRAGVEAVLDGMAAGIHARLGEEPYALLGVLRRGAPLAGRLADRIAARAGGRPPVGEIRLERYADDLTVLHERTRLEEPDLPFEVEGATVVVVDDVLYTGRTLLRAADWLASRGAGRIACAVLCSRGPNEMPVAAEFVGLRLDVGEPNVIEVRIPPYEDEPGIVIRRR